MNARREAHPRSLTRRHLLGTLSGVAVLAGAGLAGPVLAQDAAPAAAPADPGQPFSYDGGGECYDPEIGPNQTAPFEQGQTQQPRRQCRQRDRKLLCFR